MALKARVLIREVSAIAAPKLKSMLPSERWEAECKLAELILLRSAFMYSSARNTFWSTTRILIISTSSLWADFAANRREHATSSLWWGRQLSEDYRPCFAWIVSRRCLLSHEGNNKVH